MPTYVYRCSKCGHEFEKFQKISDPPRGRCPECRGKAERVITGGAALLFKGSGFYVTDYRSPGYRKAEQKEKGDGAGEAKGASGDAAAKKKTEVKEGKK